MNIPLSMDFYEVKTWAMQDAPELEGAFSEEKKKISEEVLQIGLNWVKMESYQAGTTDADRHHRRLMCKKYIKNKFLEKQRSAGFVLEELILYIILNAVIGWVIRRLLDNWLDIDI